jgi:hypothetical protein
MSKLGASRNTARRIAFVGAWAVALALPSAAQAFNPQPDPPGRAITTVTAAGLASGPVFFPPGPCLVA